MERTQSRRFFPVPQYLASRKFVDFLNISLRQIAIVSISPDLGVGDLRAGAEVSRGERGR